MGKIKIGIFSFFLIISLLLIIFFPRGKHNETKPGNCLILPMNLCLKGKLIETKNPNGQIFSTITIDLPENTPIFSPINGELSKAKVNTGYLGVVIDPTDSTMTTFEIQGDIKFNDVNTVKVKKGDIIGYTTHASEKKTPLGSHTVYLNITSSKNGAIVNNANKLRELFP